MPGLTGGSSLSESESETETEEEARSGISSGGSIMTTGTRVSIVVAGLRFLVVLT